MTETAVQTTRSPAALRLIARIGFRPRRTMRDILDTPAVKASVLVVIVLAVLRTFIGMPMAFYGMAVDRVGLAGTIGIALALLVGVSVLAVGFWLLFSWIVLFSGRWLGGTGSYGGIRTALAWSLAPLYWALLYRAPIYLFWPDTYHAIFSDDREVVRIGEEAIRISAITVPFSQVALAGIAEFLIIIWLFLTASRALAEVQGYTPWEGFANLLLGFILPAVAIGIVVAAALLAF